MSQTTPSGVTGFTQWLNSEQSWKPEAVIYGNSIYRDGRLIYQGRQTVRFTTIWSLPGLPLRERIDRTLDLWSMNAADYLPRRLAYWITMRQIGRATMKSPHVPATPLDDVLKNLGRIREGKPVEAWEAPHDSWFYPDEDHSEHVHVNPKDLMSEKTE